MRAKGWLMFVSVLLVIGLAACGGGSSTGGGGTSPAGTGAGTTSSSGSGTTSTGAVTTAATAAPAAASVSNLQAKGTDPSEVAVPWTQGGDAALKVTSCRAFRQGLGEGVHLIGEVLNTGDKTLSDIKLDVVGAAAGGRVVDTRSEGALVTVVAPGGKAPFKVFYVVQDVKTTTITTTGKATDAKPATLLEVSNVEMSAPKSGYSHVTGEVKNTQAVAVPVVRLVVMLRDAGGNPVDVVEYDLPTPFEAGASQSFDVIALHHGAAKAEVRAEVKQSK